MNYDLRRPLLLTIDASSIGIGWKIEKDDDEENRYVLRFGKVIQYLPMDLCIGQKNCRM